MTPDVQPADLRQAATVCRRALGPYNEHDWAVPAGELTWDVRKTVCHMRDAVGWYAAHLAHQSPRRLRFDFIPHSEASNFEALDVLEAAAATLADVATAATPGVRAYHMAGMADAVGFLAMGCDEILIHCWDAVHGLGGEFAPPVELVEPVLRRLFPWAPTDASVWQALLWANGRVDLPGHPRPASDWVWHCAPLNEWDGTVPHYDDNPPSRYVWDPTAGRWTGASSERS